MVHINKHKFFLMQILKDIYQILSWQTVLASKAERR